MCCVFMGTPTSLSGVCVRSGLTSKGKLTQKSGDFRFAGVEAALAQLASWRHDESRHFDGALRTDLAHV